MLFAIEGFDFGDYDDGEWTPDSAGQENWSPQNHSDWAQTPQPTSPSADPSSLSTPDNTPPGIPDSPITPSSPNPVLYENTEEIHRRWSPKILPIAHRFV